MRIRVQRIPAPRLVAVGFAFAFAALGSGCVYMKMNPPPDADKAFQTGNNSCYLATAANMLAGAGYGDGTTVQARADDIYGDLTGQFGTANTGSANRKEGSTQKERTWFHAATEAGTDRGYRILNRWSEGTQRRADSSAG